MCGVFGLKEIAAKTMIKQAGGSWATFLKWMHGQTVSSYPDGSTNFYRYDVERFIGYDCDPGKEPLEDFD